MIEMGENDGIEMGIGSGVKRSENQERRP